MILIDTNIFLEVLLARARKEASKELLRSLRDGREKGMVTDFTIHSIIVIMDGLKRLKELRTFLSSLTAYKGLSVYHTNIADEIRAIELTDEISLDMDDAIQYASALSTNAEAIVSFDKHFNGLKIPRTEPS